MAKGKKDKSKKGMGKRAKGKKSMGDPYKFSKFRGPTPPRYTHTRNRNSRPHKTEKRIPRQGNPMKAFNEMSKRLPKVEQPLTNPFGRHPQDLRTGPLSPVRGPPKVPKTGRSLSEAPKGRKPVKKRGSPRSGRRHRSPSSGRQRLRNQKRTRQKAKRESEVRKHRSMIVTGEIADTDKWPFKRSPPPFDFTPVSRAPRRRTRQSVSKKTSAPKAKSAKKTSASKAKSPKKTSTSKKV